MEDIKQLIGFAVFMASSGKTFFYFAHLKSLIKLKANILIHLQHIFFIFLDLLIIYMFCHSTQEYYFLYYVVIFIACALSLYGLVGFGPYYKEKDEGYVSFIKNLLYYSIIILLLYYIQIETYESSYNGFNYTETVCINQYNKPKSYEANNEKHLPKELLNALKILDESSDENLEFSFYKIIEDTNKKNLFLKIDNYNILIENKIDSLTNKMILESKKEYYSEKYLSELLKQVEDLMYSEQSEQFD